MFCDKAPYRGNPKPGPLGHDLTRKALGVKGTLGGAGDDIFVKNFIKGQAGSCYHTVVIDRFLDIRISLPG